MLKQNLQQKLLQKLSPQQLQFIKLLQIPTALLDARIKEELEANPALEDKSLTNNNSPEDTYNVDNNDDNTTQETGNNEEATLSIDEILDLNEESPYNTYNANSGDDSSSEMREVPITVKNSFYENLINQLKLININDKQFIIAKQIIGSLDDDGYLHRQLSSIADDILFATNMNVSEQELEEVLKVIQALDPPGIAARSLQECLLIQLLKKDNGSTTIKLAIDIIKNHLLEFTRKHYDKLTKALNITLEELKLAVNEIIKLNPKPGDTDINSGSNQIHITPDFIVTNNDGELILTLNARNAPELHINKDYKNMLSAYSEQAVKDKKLKETVQFVKQKIDSAKWFIDAIKQRQQTLLKVMNSIMQFQYEFFIDGDEKKLKPMILKDIADKINMDISTVSRVANSKYVQTNFGTFILKGFFSEAIQTSDGDEVSNKEVKKILKECIENEGKLKPLSDSKLTQILKEKGYNIARRTVAKYREQLNIPVARLRKEII